MPQFCGTKPNTPPTSSGCKDEGLARQHAGGCTGAPGCAGVLESITSSRFLSSPSHGEKIPTASLARCIPGALSCAASPRRGGCAGPEPLRRERASPRIRPRSAGPAEKPERFPPRQERAARHGAPRRHPGALRQTGGAARSGLCGTLAAAARGSSAPAPAEAARANLRGQAAPPRGAVRVPRASHARRGVAPAQASSRAVAP